MRCCRIHECKVIKQSIVISWNWNFALNITIIIALSYLLKYTNCSICCVCTLFGAVTFDSSLRKDVNLKQDNEVIWVSTPPLSIDIWVRNSVLNIVKEEVAGTFTGIDKGNFNGKWTQANFRYDTICFAPRFFSMRRMKRSRSKKVGVVKRLNKVNWKRVASKNTD